MAGLYSENKIFIKTGGEKMKRLAAWIVLYLISVVVELVTSVVVGVGRYILSLIGELNLFLRIIIYLLGGSTFISLLFLPAYYGALINVSLCETICESKKGTRYLVFTIYMLITNIIYAVMSGSSDLAFYINIIIMCIYFILILFLSKAFSSKHK